MDHTDVGLQAAIRALNDVVEPVVGKEHAQARDQLRLTTDYLAFVIERLPHLHQRDRFELSHHLAMAREVHAALPASSAPELAAAMEAAQQMLERAGPSTADVRQATAALSAAVSAVVRGSASLVAAAQRDIERAVLHASEHRIAFERAWYLPLGLDPDPHDVQPLATFLPA
ncbi:hypothetical protein [Hydrogenophaga sp. BPS33]|uniref:hypothetical protein n=1 Tax=Hydrogenophaga sp. BPS33 TaxID=2651974 RepID=UPI00131FCA29|nr:hypothetical protein [Hydrogenophaga sp. BPS33]QHE88120.1 hypothetical protein F9K07_26105 [Hydrogenophaga sp. BPS33]